MIAYVLGYKYSDGQSGKPIRIYHESLLEQAKSDLAMMKEHASDCRSWFLYECDYIGPLEPTLNRDGTTKRPALITLKLSNEECMTLLDEIEGVKNLINAVDIHMKCESENTPLAKLIKELSGKDACWIEVHTF